MTKYINGLQYNEFPTQGGNSGKYLTTNAVTVSWNSVDALPSQTGNSGKFLTTNGSASSWATISTTSTVLVQRTIEGPVYESTLMYWVAPTTCTISSVSMALSSNPATTGNCKVQVMKNGLLETNSIFASDVPVTVTESTTATNGVYIAAGTLDSNYTTLAANDVIHFRVNEAASGSTLLS